MDSFLPHQLGSLPWLEACGDRRDADIRGVSEEVHHRVITSLATTSWGFPKAKTMGIDRVSAHFGEVKLRRKAHRSSYRMVEQV